MILFLILFLMRGKKYTRFLYWLRIISQIHARILFFLKYYIEILHLTFLDHISIAV